MPNEIVSKFINNRDDFTFFIGSTPISGVQSANYSFTNSLIPLKAIGLNTGIYIPNGAQNASFSISCYLINKDYLINFTGNTGINGYFIKDVTLPQENNFSFTSGYLTSYGSTCSIGQIPQYNASFTIFGNVGHFNSGESPFVSGDFKSFIKPQIGTDIKVANYSDISLNLNDFNTNRVMGYNVDITVPRLALYENGNRFPIAIDIAPPIEVNVGLQYEIDSYSGYTMRNYPNTPKIDNILIEVRKPITNEIISNFAFSGMTLLSEDFSMAVDGAVTVSANYRKCIID